MRKHFFKSVILIGLVFLSFCLSPNQLLAQEDSPSGSQEDSSTKTSGSTEYTTGSKAIDSLNNSIPGSISNSKSSTSEKTGQVITDIAGSVEGLNFFQNDIGVFVTRAIEVALIVGSILVLAYLIWGGLDWTSSSGDKTKYENARNKITAALVGLTIMASAWALWVLANYFLGIDKLIQTGGKAIITGTEGEASMSSGVQDCCPLMGTSSACCDYLQSKGDYYVSGRYQYPQYCDQLYINWGLWQQDWQKNVGDSDEEDPC